MSLIKDTLYAKYILEREEMNILEDEYCFVTYRILGQSLYVKDAHIEESKRGGFTYKRFLNELIEIAKAQDCRAIMTTVYLWDKNKDYNLQCNLKAGFKVVSVGLEEGGFITLAKNIINEEV
jgi:hypothetical protein